MSNYQLLSAEHFGNKRWQRYSNYRFAAQHMVAPITLYELHRASLCLPLAFMAHKDGMKLAAVTGFQHGQNLLLDAHGQWRVDYIPAVYRSYPFALVPLKDGNNAIAVDMDSGLITDREGAPLLDAQGKLTEEVSAVVDFLTQLEAGKSITDKACQVLQQHDLLVPWKLEVELASGQRQLRGLYRVDENRLNALSAESLKEVQSKNGLMLIYLHLLSLQHINQLHKWAMAEPAPQDVEGLFEGQDDTLKFNF
jgi:hypothetical protein